jgi:hypothetical protein
VGGGYGIWRWTGSTFVPVDGGGVAISGGSDGLPWLVNNLGQVWERVY